MARKLILFMILAIFAAAPAGAQVLGDVNNDGKINEVEAIFALRAAAGMSNLPAQEDLEKIEDNITAMGQTLYENLETIQSMEDIQDVVENAGFQDGLDAQSLLELFLALKNTNCFDLSREPLMGVPTSLILTATGDPNCPTITSGEIVISAMAQAVDCNGIVLTVEFKNLVVNECNYNGAAQLTICQDAQLLIIRLDATDLTMCQQTLKGWVKARFSLITGLLVDAEAETETTFVIENVNYRTILDLIYIAPPTNTINGTMQFWADADKSTVVLTDLYIDPVCGIPTGGVMTVTDEALNFTYTVDFTITTCDNPEAMVTINNGITIKMNLNDLVAIIEAM